MHQGTAELGGLEAVGFGDSHVLGVVVAESRSSAARWLISGLGFGLRAHRDSLQETQTPNGLVPFGFDFSCRYLFRMVERDLRVRFWRSMGIKYVRRPRSTRANALI